MSSNVLVTGGTGFLATEIIFQLLKNGYHVKTTLRSLKSQTTVMDTLKSNGIMNFEALSFIEADLLRDDHWDEAMNGCDYVLSVASPVFFSHSKDERAVIRPAVDGIVRILKAARNAGVKRVVMTANFGAVGFSNTNPNHVTTETDWTDPNEKGLSLYEKSKLLAELAAWDFIKKEGQELELTTINPVAILGPSLSPHVSGSFGLLEHLLDGSMKAVPHIPLNIVDVRDVADLHLRAMTNPDAKGQRFIASGDGQISLPEIAALIKNNRPEAASKVSTRTLPNWLVHFSALLNQQAKEGALLLKINRNISNEKAKKILGWSPLATIEATILSSIDSMIQFKRIK